MGVAKPAFVCQSCFDEVMRITIREGSIQYRKVDLTHPIVGQGHIPNLQRSFKQVIVMLKFTMYMGTLDDYRKLLFD